MEEDTTAGETNPTPYNPFTAASDSIYEIQEAPPRALSHRCSSDASLSPSDITLPIERKLSMDSTESSDTSLVTLALSASPAVSIGVVSERAQETNVSTLRAPAKERPLSPAPFHKPLPKRPAAHKLTVSEEILPSLPPSLPLVASIPSISPNLVGNNDNTASDDCVSQVSSAECDLDFHISEISTTVSVFQSTLSDVHEKAPERPPQLVHSSSSSDVKDVLTPEDVERSDALPTDVLIEEQKPDICLKLNSLEENVSSLSESANLDIDALIKVFDQPAHFDVAPTSSFSTASKKIKSLKRAHDSANNTPSKKHKTGGATSAASTPKRVVVRTDNGFAAVSASSAKVINEAQELRDSILFSLLAPHPSPLLQDESVHVINDAGRTNIDMAVRLSDSSIIASVVVPSSALLNSSPSIKRTQRRVFDSRFKPQSSENSSGRNQESTDSYSQEKPKPEIKNQERIFSNSPSKFTESPSKTLRSLGRSLVKQKKNVPS